MSRAFPSLDARGTQHLGLTKLEYHASLMMLVLIPLRPEWPYQKIAEHAVEAARALMNQLEKQ